MFFFFDKKQQNKDNVPQIKTLRFKEIVAVLYGVFAEFLSEILPFVLFFDKKEQNKDDVPRIKYVTFF